MSSTADDHLSQLPRLGVGLSLQDTLTEFVREHLDAFDYLEVVPDSLWNDRGRGTRPRYEEKTNALDFLSFVAEHKPIIGHSIGLSIGTDDAIDTEHVDQIASWQDRYEFPWHSDHLSFNRLDHASGHSIDVGFTMPVPYDSDVLDLLASKVEHMQRHVPAPFLLENNVYYFQIPEQEMTEAEFLNRLTERTGCGLLLDLHNVYVNSRNHGFDPREFLDGFDLTRVVEMHIAGGLSVDDVYLDAHSGPCPDEVWELLDWIMPRVPNLKGVTFEVFSTYYPKMGPERLLEELTRAREATADHFATVEAR
ncbi:MAG: DUF692 domain-containing protein [Acidobacteriota bacterium]